jgi:hypothetical protein
MKRSAIALMLTLFMILAMSAALSITLGLFQKNFDNYSSNVFRVQSTVLLVDAVEMMKALSKDIGESPEAFSLLMATVQELPLRVGSVDMIIKLEAKASRFNINHYEREKHYEKLYAYLLNYNVQRPGYILEMIEDSLDNDKDEQSYGSERVLYDPFFVQGKLIDFVQFSKLLDTYAKETKDINIYTVPWNAWMDFSSEFIDEAYMTGELQTVLQSAGGVSELLEDFDKTGENSSDVRGEVYLSHDEAQSIANFEFSFKNKKVSNFKAIL